MKNRRLACWYLVAVTTQHGTTVSGIVIKKPRFSFGHNSIFGHFLSMLGSFLYRPHSKAAIEVLVGDEKQQAKTNEYGFFEAKFELAFEKAPIKLFYNKADVSCLFKADYPTNFALKPQQTLVISDVDDTVIQSFTASARRRIGTILFTPPAKRKSVAFTKQLISSLEKKGAFVSYVSRSEANLFGVIGKILSNQAIPTGPIYLAPFVTLGQLVSGINKAGLKQKHIEEILLNNTTQPVVLLGDDTQEDLEIYGRISNKFPKRIKHIYIHQTTATKKKQVTDLAERLVDSGVPVLYFKKTDDGVEAAKKLWL